MSHSDPAGAPVCPRHPDRVAYVRCQRCGRPACPDCQRPAAVGIQCVDCVAQASREAPRATTRFGGTPRRTTRPLVTLVLIGLCVLTYLGQQLNDEVTVALWFGPWLAETEPWRFLTAAFVHSPSGFMHIVFNMYALYLVGGYLEPMLGRARYLALYLVSALGGSVAVLLLASVPEGWFTPTVGASGAVFGLFGAMLVLNRHLGRDTTGILVILGINMVIGFLVSGISWQAHVGGAVTGVVIAGIYALTSSRGRDRKSVTRRRLAWPGLAVLVLLLGALSVWRIHEVTGTVVWMFGS